MHYLSTRGRDLEKGERMHLFQQRGEFFVCQQEGENSISLHERYSVQGENLSLHAHVQGEYAFVQGELLWFVVLCFGGLLFALSHLFRGSL